MAGPNFTFECSSTFVLSNTDDPPILFNHKIINKLNYWFSSFIWCKRRPRFRMSVLIGSRYWKIPIDCQYQLTGLFCSSNRAVSKNLFFYCGFCSVHSLVRNIGRHPYPAEQCQFPGVCLLRGFGFGFASFSFLGLGFAFPSCSSCSSCCSSSWCSLGRWTFRPIGG